VTTLPIERPEAIFAAVTAAFANGDLWFKALVDPEAYYQRMALMYHYLHETPEGFILTDPGKRSAGPEDTTMHAGMKPRRRPGRL
jgi:hypothetical protein